MSDGGDKPNRPFVHFIAGGLGGAVGIVLTCPLEVVKTRLQSSGNKAQFVQVSNNPFKFGGPGTATLHALTSLYQQEGVRGLWKGLGPNLVGVVPSRSLYFYTYNLSKQTLADSLQGNPLHLSAAVIAGATVATVTSPIWLVKTRMQLQSAHGSKFAYRNSFDCVKQVWQHEGIRGFYKGLTASYVGILESSFQFVLYENFKSYRLQQKASRLGLAESEVRLEMPEWFFFSSAAKFIACVTTYPHEVIRTRLREQVTEVKYKGVISGLLLIAKEEGRAGLYGGMAAHLARVVPNAALMFMVYEQTVRFLNNAFDRRA